MAVRHWNVPPCTTAVIRTPAVLHPIPVILDTPSHVENGAQQIGTGSSPQMALRVGKWAISLDIIPVSG